MTFSELVAAMGDDNHFEFESQDKDYQAEVSIIWDDPKKKILRVDIFTDYYRKQKWWHIGDRPVYSALRSPDGSIDESIDSRIKII